MTVSNTVTYGVGSGVQNGIRTIAKGEELTDKDMFLKLMLAQLRNQDPTAPMDQKDMMASITQFSQMEQMQNMATAMETLSLTQGIGMIGREIEYEMTFKDTETGEVLGTETRTGTVAAVHQRGGQVELEMTKPPGSDPAASGVMVKPSVITKVIG
jgi:flagellar basal-body rod modification protein FlgD